MEVTEKELRKIRDKRVSRGISQKEIADMIGTTEKQYRKWEKGLEDMPPTIYDDICSVLGL